MKADLESTEFRDLAIPLVNNWQAREIRTAAEAREGLYQQIPNPVRWSTSMQPLAKLGVGNLVRSRCGSDPRRPAASDCARGGPV